MTTKELDRIDLKILEILQADGRITNQRLADQVSLSPSACLTRLRALEHSGIITGYTAQIALERLRPTMVLYAEVSMRGHALSGFDRFDQIIAGIPEIVEAARVSGPFDYLLKVVVTDMQEWKELALSLLSEANGVDKVVTYVVMIEAKAHVGPPVAPSASARRRLPQIWQTARRSGVS
jgi:Lrp/AsnC family leucine-responsive transcriptional regulator